MVSQVSFSGIDRWGSGNGGGDVEAFEEFEVDGESPGDFREIAGGKQRLIPGGLDLGWEMVETGWRVDQHVDG